MGAVPGGGRRRTSPAPMALVAAIGPPSAPRTSLGVCVSAVKNDKSRSHGLLGGSIGPIPGRSTSTLTQEVSGSSGRGRNSRRHCDCHERDEFQAGGSHACACAGAAFRRQPMDLDPLLMRSPGTMTDRISVARSARNRTSRSRRNDHGKTVAVRYALGTVGWKT